MKKTEKEKKASLEAGDAMKVQRDQLSRAEEQMASVHSVLSQHTNQGKAQDSVLDEMESLLDALEEGQIDSALPHCEYIPNTISANIHHTHTVSNNKDMTWEQYMQSVERYATLEKMDLSSDPYMSLMSRKDQETFAQMVREDFYEHKPNCDVWDYAISAFCGAVAGFIDVFFVGAPTKSKFTLANGKTLGQCTDDLSDKIVIKFAKCLGWKPKSGNEDNISLAIRYIEDIAQVNYDLTNANFGPSAEEVFPALNTTIHHLTSLAHSPDLVGLVFSCVEQFSGTIHFIDDARIIKYDREKQTLYGNDFISKLFCAICNWLRHCLSDVAGSYKTRRKGNRGSGLPIPGFELLQFIKIDAGKDDTCKTIADIAIEVYKSGYDARFGLAMTVPVAINDLAIRFCFAIKRYFILHRPFKECIPIDGGLFFKHQAELRRMFLVSQGVLCAFDLGDAVIAGIPRNVQTDLIKEKDIITALSHLNYFAWLRLAEVGMGEIRAMYRQNHIDLKLLIKKTNDEWQTMYIDVGKWKPASLYSSNEELFVE